MARRNGIMVFLALLIVGLVACGKTSSVDTAPTARDGVLFKASDIPGLRLHHQLPIPDSQVFADELSGGTLFKDDPPDVVKKLKGFGFKRGYAEMWTGAGLEGGAFVAEFDNAAHVKGALAYFDVQLFKECPNDPTCSRRERLSVPGVPNSVGQALTPLRPSNEGRHFTLYKVAFPAGNLVYGFLVGGSDNYDPGSVSKDEALSIFEAVYNRFKARSVAAVFAAVPKKPLGPPPPGPEGPEGPPSPTP